MKTLNLSVFHLPPDKVHVGVKDDESEGDDQVEEEPHIYHLDVGRGGEILPNLNILGDG